ncbi:MAG: PD40 domain-containing protein [Bacteroidetes bacterium]|nr:PD40 domain-containing protein [Bacteroidota bacterium]
MKTIYIILLCVFFSTLGFSQKNSQYKKELKAANLAYEKADYLNAFNYFSDLIKKDTSDAELWFKAGASLFNMNKMDTSSTYYFEKSKTKIPEAHYYLGKTYQLQGQTRKALDELYHFKSVNKEESIENSEVDKVIRACESNIKEEANKESFIVRNLGSGINSKYPEYVPLVWNVNGSLIFTSRRADSKGGLKDPYGRYYEDIYVAQKTSTGWSKPGPIGDDINTQTHDACVAMSPSGNELIIYRTDEKQTGGDFYLCQFDGTKWSLPQKMGPEINSEYLEASACFSSDGTEIVFSSNRPGGFGGKDLYRIRKFMNGKYSLPFNLGPDINTNEDEDAPFVDKDNTLYFSSKGHNSIGEYDIFKSAFDAENLKWLEAKTLGVPINSPNDDIYFMKIEDSQKALFTSRREGGFGDADLYQIDFEESSQVIVYCKLNTVIEKSELKDLVMSCYDAETGQLEGIYRPNKNYMSMILVMTKDKPYKMILEGNMIEPVIKRMTFATGDTEISLEVSKRIK